MEGIEVVGAGDVPVTLDSEVVSVDATGQGDVPITLDSETVELSSITVDLLLDGITGIVRELRLMNLHMASITGLDINREDVEA